MGTLVWIKKYIFIIWYLLNIDFCDQKEYIRSKCPRFPLTMKLLRYRPLIENNAAF